MKLEKMSLADLHILLDSQENEKTIVIRPSGLQEFSNNPLSWALKQIAGFYFPNSVQTVLGTGFHSIINSYLTGKSLNNSLIDGAKSIKNAFRHIEKKDSQTVFSIYKTAKNYFINYYLPYADSIKKSLVCSEQEMEVSFANNVICRGTCDHIIEENGESIICDVKTARNGFSANIDFDGLEVIKEKEALVKKLGLKKTKEDEKESIQKRIDEISVTASKLEEEYQKLCYQEFCKQAEKKYGLQLAVYAMLYEANFGTVINKARIELLIKNQTPKFEIYEFELTNMKNISNYQLEILEETISLWRKGISSKVLFNYNNSTFFGEELKEIIGY